MRPCPHPIERLVPQAHPMILLDRVVGISDDRIEAAVTVRIDAPFFVPGRGVPAHAAIEWMAQACAAFVGVGALESGQPVRIGFLLGTRDFSAMQPWFKAGETLAVTAVLTFRDEEMGVFECAVERAGRTAAAAHLTVYQPKDPSTLLRSKQVSP